MELVRWETFEALSRLHHHINFFFDDGFGRGPTLLSATPGAWLPPVDVLESKDGYLIRAELPGVKKEDFNLQVNDGTLTLSGERKAEPLSDGVAFHRAERVNGKFPGSFNLPQSLQQDSIKANYRDGILEIHVLKAEEAKPRQFVITLN